MGALVLESALERPGGLPGGGDTGAIAVGIGGGQCSCECRGWRLGPPKWWDVPWSGAQVCGSGTNLQGPPGMARKDLRRTPRPG